MAGPGRGLALRRLAKLYGAVEQMHTVALRVASAAVTEADQAIGLARGMSQEANRRGREALTSGNRGEWTMSESERQMAGQRRESLETLREARAVLRDAAQVEFQASRMRTEQMKQVVGDMRRKAEIEEARRVQAASDDRFLTRLRWRSDRDVRE